jgi:sterol desaturase/sphingolipid hydroxylase (fatty acid hydroxylase superfamily)
MTDATIETGAVSWVFRGRVVIYYTLLFLFLCFALKQLAFGASLARAALSDWNTAWLVIANNSFLIVYAIEAVALFREDGSFARMSLARLARFSGTRETDLYLWVFISFLYVFGQEFAMRSSWYSRHFPLFDLGPWLGGDLGMFFFLSFLGYLIHLLSHKVPALWELHKIHHSATEMTGFTVSREHIFFELFHLLLFASLFNLSNVLVSKVFLARGVLYILQHTQVNAKFGWLGHLIFSPHAHHIHHQNDSELSSRNFGLDITLWDRLFGSFLYEIPRSAAEMDRNFGLPPAESPLGNRHVFLDLYESARRAFAVLRGRGSRPAG